MDDKHFISANANMNLLKFSADILSNINFTLHNIILIVFTCTFFFINCLTIYIALNRKPYLHKVSIKYTSTFRYNG